MTDIIAIIHQAAWELKPFYALMTILFVATVCMVIPGYQDGRFSLGTLRLAVGFAIVFLALCFIPKPNPMTEQEVVVENVKEEKEGFQEQLICIGVGEEGSEFVSENGVKYTATSIESIEVGDSISLDGAIEAEGVLVADVEGENIVFTEVEADKEDRGA